MIFGLFSDKLYRKKSTLPYSIWVSAKTCRSLTVNDCESFQSKFNSNVYRRRFNIFKIIDVLKIFQINTYIKIKISDTIEFEK
jgi:hypothetical protein